MRKVDWKYKSIIRAERYRRNEQTRSYDEIVRINKDQTPIEIKYDEAYRTKDGSLVPIKVYRTGNAVCGQHWVDYLSNPTVRSTVGRRQERDT